MASSSSSPGSISAVVIAHDEGEQLGATVHALLATLPEDAEVVVVDDDSSDGAPQGLRDAYPSVRVLQPPIRVGPAVARNIGARASTGGVLLFSDAHVTPPMGWVEPLVDVVRHPDVGAVAPAVAVAGHEAACGYGRTWRDTGLRSRWLSWSGQGPQPVPLLGGCFVVMRRAVFDDCGGFDDGLPRWGCEDDEISVRLWLLGYECRVVPDVAVTHLFRTRFPYRVESAGVVHNLLRMAVVHLTGPRLGQAITALQRRPQFAAALARVLEGDACARRAALARRRTRDDAWFCGRFNIPRFEEAAA